MTLLYYIYDATGLYKKTLYIAYKIYDSKDIFPLTDTYASQISNLFVDCLLIEVWDLPPLSTTVGGEIKRLVRRN